MAMTTAGRAPGDRRAAATGRLLKRLARDWLPPALLPVAERVHRVLRRRVDGRWVFDPRPEWSYLRAGWPEPPAGAGWHDPSIVAAQQAKWPGFAAIVGGRGPLGVGHEGALIEDDSLGAHNMLLSFGYVLARAAHGRERLAVLDWGGGMGHYAAVARALLPEVACDYTVKDFEGLCEAGRAVQPDVRFETDEEAALARGYDLVLASSSLQYVRDWRNLVGRLAAASREWVYLTRVPLVAAAATHVVLQRPHHVGYETEYASWVFNRGEFLAAAAESGLALEREFLIGESPPVAGAPARSQTAGFLFSRSARP